MLRSTNVSLGIEIAVITDAHNELNIRVYDDEGDKVYLYAFTGEHLRANLKRYLEKLREEGGIRGSTESDYFNKIDRFISLCILDEIPRKRIPHS